MNAIPLDEARMYVLQTGPRGAEPVVLLHGYMGSHRTWRHLQPALSTALTWAETPGGSWRQPF